MMTFFVVYGAIGLFASLIAFMDYFGRRQQRKARGTAQSSCPSPHADDFWP
jgi:hypothetical protein